MSVRSQTASTTPGQLKGSWEMLEVIEQLGDNFATGEIVLGSAEAGERPIKFDHGAKKIV